MNGMRFLQLDREGKPSNHGIVVQQLTTERYMCQFARLPSSCLIRSLDEMLSWHFFATEDELNKFIVHVSAAKQPPAPAKKPRKKRSKKSVKN